MTASRRSFLTSSAAAAFLATHSAPARSQGIDTKAIDDVVKDTLRDWEVPGAAVVIVQGDRVVYLKGFGVRELSAVARVTPDTLFPLASCSKAFTTLAMAMLVDEGKMQWDDPVRRHVPFFHLSDPLADANVTLRDLVSHRTGVAGHELLFLHVPWGPEECIRRIGHVPLSRSFRSTYQYQSIMFMAAGYAVATASGTPWSDFVRQRICAPLNLANMHFSSAPVLAVADRTGCHRRNRQGKTEVIPPYRFAVPDPSCSVYTSARELGKWLRFQLGDGTSNGRRLVSAENLGETHMPQTVIRVEGGARRENPFTTQMSYAMGWVVQDYHGHKLVSHAGIIDGTRTHITLAPNDQLGLAIVSNLHATRMNLSLSNLLVDRILGLPYKDWHALFLPAVKEQEEAWEAICRQRAERRHRNTKPSLALSAYSGCYEHPAYGTAKIDVDDGRLTLHWSSFHCPLEHYHFDTFTITQEELLAPDLTFALDATGAVASVRFVGVDFQKAAG